MKLCLVTALLLLATLACSGTSSSSGDDSDTGLATDAATDTDSSSSTGTAEDSSTETDTSSSTEVDSATDTGTGTDTAIDTETGTDTGRDTENDTDSADCYLGDYVIEGDTDWSELQPYRCLLGDLIIQETEVVMVPPLEMIKIAGDLWIGGNADLADISGFAHLIEVTDTLSVVDNDALVSLAGLEKVKTVGLELDVAHNLVLEGLEPLASLRNLADLKVSTNPEIEALTGLEQLDDLRRINIYDNASLSDISALGNVFSSWFLFNLFENPLLPFCDVCELYGRLNSEPGMVTIHHNLSDACWDTDLNQ